MNLSFGYNNLKYTVPEKYYETVDIPDSIALGVQLNVGRFYFGGDFRVFKKLFLSGGFQYNNYYITTSFGLTRDYTDNVPIDVVGTPDDTSDDIIGRLVVPNELIGQLNIVVRGKQYAPYAAIVFGEPIPKKRFGYRIALGVVFQGNFTASTEERIIDTGFNDRDRPGETIKYSLSENSAVVDGVAEFNKLAEPYRWLPYLSIGFRVKM